MATMQGATAPREEDLPPRPQLRIRTPRADLEEEDTGDDLWFHDPPRNSYGLTDADRQKIGELYFAYWGMNFLPFLASYTFGSPKHLLVLLVTIPLLIRLHTMIFTPP